MDKSRTTAYHPEGNGQIERFNRVIADTVSKYCADNPRTWDEYLPYVTFVYNTTVHKTTKVTPFSLVYGQECQYPIDLFYPKPIDHEYKDGGDFATNLHETFREVQANARQVLGSTQKRRKDLYHKKVYGEPYKEGDKVWLFSPHKAKSRKFFLPWEGPFVVGERLNEVVYKIWKETKPSKWFTVHFNRLKPYKCTQPEPRKMERSRPQMDETPFDYNYWEDELLELETPPSPPRTRRTKAEVTKSRAKSAANSDMELSIIVPSPNRTSSTPQIFTPSTPIPANLLPTFTFLTPNTPPFELQPTEGQQIEEAEGTELTSPSLFPPGQQQHEDRRNMWSLASSRVGYEEVGETVPRNSLYNHPDESAGDTTVETQQWNDDMLRDENGEQVEERFPQSPCQQDAVDATAATTIAMHEREDDTAGLSQQSESERSRPKRMRYRPLRYGIDY